MSKIDTAQIMAIVDKALAVREELSARGIPAGDVTVMTGCAIGVLLTGDRG